MTEEVARQLEREDPTLVELVRKACQGSDDIEKQKARVRKALANSAEFRERLCRLACDELTYRYRKYVRLVIKAKPCSRGALEDSVRASVNALGIGHSWLLDDGSALCEHRFGDLEPFAAKDDARAAGYRVNALFYRKVAAAGPPKGIIRNHLKDGDIEALLREAQREVNGSDE